MITEPTVLILGAGASCPFDFPSGKALYDQITQELASPDTTNLGKILIACGIAPFDLRQFSKCLSQSGLSSVDQFLERQGDGWLKLGKHAIAASLLPRENNVTLFRDTHDHPNWLKVLFQRMNSTIGSFNQNKLTVITYNYDRSIEQFFFTSLKNIFENSDAAAAKVVNEIQIIHLHGQLTPLFGPPGQVVGYGDELSFRKVQHCANSIRIIHESIDDSSEYAAAHKAIEQARRIAFLGFGFHNTNLKRLLSKPFPDGPIKPKIFASTYGFGAAERDEIESYLRSYFIGSPVAVGSGTQDINDMLHDFPILPFL